MMGMLSGLGSSTASMQSSLSNVSQLFQNEGQREGSGWTRGLLGSMILQTCCELMVIQPNAALVIFSSLSLEISKICLS